MHGWHLDLNTHMQHSPSPECTVQISQMVTCMVPERPSFLFIQHQAYVFPFIIYIYIFLFLKKEKRKSAKTQKNKNKLRENASETPTSELFVFSASTYCASQFHYINAVVSILAAPLLPWISEHSRFFNSLFKSYSNAHLLNFNLFWQIVLQEFQALRWKSEGTYFLFVVRQFLSFESFVFVFVVFLFFYF